MAVHGQTLPNPNLLYVNPCSPTCRTPAVLRPYTDGLPPAVHRGGPPTAVHLPYSLVLLAIFFDPSWLHLPVSGWCRLAKSGSRKRITVLDASRQPLRHGNRRWGWTAPSPPAPPAGYLREPCCYPPYTTAGHPLDHRWAPRGTPAGTGSLSVYNWSIRAVWPTLAKAPMFHPWVRSAVALRTSSDGQPDRTNMVNNGIAGYPWCTVPSGSSTGAARPSVLYPAEYSAHYTSTARAY